MNRTFATIAVILASCCTTYGQSNLIPNSYVDYTASHVPQDFTISLPEGYPLELAVAGADGGNAIAGSFDQCTSSGGQGATVSGVFMIGTGSGQLAPGGTIRFILGEHGSDSNRTFSAAGAGGGGSAILYLPPGGSWSTPYGQPGAGQILLAAGGGGGATQKVTFGVEDCVNGTTGGNGVQTECGGEDGGGNNSGAPGCNGQAGQDFPSIGEAGNGAFGAISLYQQGWPAGGESDQDPPDGVTGGWGFGPGGASDYVSPNCGGGGGGGYSGGAGGGRNHNGGGGGSFYASFAIDTTYAIDTFIGEGRNGRAAIYCVQPSNTNADGAFAFTAGETLAGLPCFPDFEAIATPCPASSYTGDVWYRYDSPNASCTQTLSFSWTSPETAVSAHSINDPGTTLDCSNNGQFSIEVAPSGSLLIRIASGLAGFEVLTSASNPDPGNNGVCNDLCVYAIPLLDGVITGTLANATHDVYPSCSSGPDQTEDIWYSYTNTASCQAEVTVSTCSGDYANELRMLAVYYSCAGPEIACDAGTVEEPCASITWTMEPGETHLIRLSRTSNSNPLNDFTLTVSSIGAGDRDNDGVEDACDNCLDDPNLDQVDTDGDGAGDACDTCPGFDDFADADGDTVADACDVCPGFDDLQDADGDAVPDDCDPCPNNNPDDVDGNGTCGGQILIEGNLQSGITYFGDLNPPSAIADQPCATSEPGTYDFWTFSATAGDTIMIELDRLDPDLDPTMSLWAGNLNGASLDDFSSPTVNPVQTLVTIPPDNELPATIANQIIQGDGEDPALVGFVAPNTGTYTVLVAGICNAAVDDNTYSIRLDLNAEAIIRNVSNNATYQTLQGAISNALSGHVIEISAGVVFEDNIFWPNNKELTIRGAGPGVTFIDAEVIASTSPILTIGTGLTSATVISDMTLRKDIDVGFGYGAIDIYESSPTIRNVTFEGNYGFADPFTGGIDITVSGAAANPVIEQCVFLDGRAGFANARVFDGASATFINCAFDPSTRLDGSTITSISVENGNVSLVNCTVGGLLDQTGTPVTAVNTAFLVTPPAGFTLNNCLYPGATGNSIDGVPTFVDLAGNDLRLTSTSLGIDAADYDAYVAEGGGNEDAGGQARAFDDANTIDTGSGTLTYLDIGAYEYFIDSDNDGVGDGSDVCPGFDDNLDADNDGTPDGCDACPLDANDDSDSDGVCDSDDVCPGFDDTVDNNSNGIPDCSETDGNECPDYVDVGDETVTGSMASYTGSTGDDSSCSFNDTIDLWFRYVPTINGVLEVSTCNPGTEFDTVLSAFEGCPESGGQELVCNNDTAQPECDLNGSTGLSNLIVPITVGQEVYIRLSVYNDDFFGSGGTGASYEISFSSDTNPEGNGDECEIARVATAGSNTGTLSDNTGASGLDSSCGFENRIDEWFSYTAPTSGVVTFSTCNPNTGFDSTLSLYDNCLASGGVELACNEDGTDPVACDIFGELLLSTLEYEVTAGVTYYIRVAVDFDTFEPAGPDFELTIQEPSPPGPGDCDGDGDVDLADYALLQACLLGPGAGLGPDCDCFDFDSDSDVDLGDFAEFQVLFGS